MNRLTYALLAFGLMGNAASALAQAPAAVPQPTGSWLYTVTIPVDDIPANNIVFQGVETYIPGGGLDPVSLVGNFVPGSISLFTRQWGKAIEQLRGAIDLDPNYWLNHVLLGRAYEQQGKFSAAIDEFQKALKLDEDHAEIWSALGHARTVSGNAAEARKIRDRLQSPAELSYVAPYNVAIGYAGLGDKEQTFAWLEKAFRQRSYYLPIYFPTDSRLDGVHADAQYRDLLRRVGLPE